MGTEREHMWIFEMCWEIVFGYKTFHNLVAPTAKILKLNKNTRSNCFCKKKYMNENGSNFSVTFSVTFQFQLRCTKMILTYVLKIKSIFSVTFQLNLFSDFSVNDLFSFFFSQKYVFSKNKKDETIKQYHKYTNHMYKWKMFTRKKKNETNLYETVVFLTIPWSKHKSKMCKMD